jgi:hypothetical protein
VHVPLAERVDDRNPARRRIQSVPGHQLVDQARSVGLHKQHVLGEQPVSGGFNQRANLMPPSRPWCRHPERNPAAGDLDDGLVGEPRRWQTTATGLRTLRTWKRSPQRGVRSAMRHQPRAQNRPPGA